jgi:P-type Ca2+ transporter type 2C
MHADRVADADVKSHPWHTYDDPELFEKLASGEQGLHADDVPRRLAQFGRNTLEADEAVSLAKLVLMQLHNPLIYLLLGAAALSLATGHAIDAAVIAGVVLLNTVLGASQEYKASRALEALHNLAAPHARAIRDGREVEISAEEIVPGDILVLETGDLVAADARVIQAAELHANESALTGESEPVHKTPGAMEADRPLAELRNMVWMSTAVTTGRGRAVVVGTGMNTTLGRIAGQVRHAGREQTPLQRRMARLGVMLGIAGIALAALIFLLGLLRSYGLVEMALFAVAVAVAAIPEGLPAVISVTLALGVQRMARRNALIRRLPAVETLGSTTVICSDKTGTITRNEMTVTDLWTPGGAYAVTGSGFEPAGKIHPHGRPDLGGQLSDDTRTLLRIGLLCNNASLNHDDDVWSIRGTPTEGAILVAVHKACMDVEALVKAQPRLNEVPFSSEHKYMATLHPAEQDGTVALVKGAPDRVLAFCTHVLLEGQAVELTDEQRAEIEAANQHLAGQALRVVSGAVRPMPPGRETLQREDVEQGLVFVGLWGLVDPPRPEAIQAVADAQGAGIRVVMITGDHAVTAEAIARQAGIIGDGRNDVLTGQGIDAMTPEQLKDCVKTVSVFARVSPAHKLQILRALKANGEIVAMTGDGVNDAPALKGADIGVAMGRAGTEVAKEAADMVLADDDFATIVHAVEDGRVTFSNLQRVVFFLITTNLGEILTLAAALMIGMPLPLTAIMILWINLVTDGVCTLPLGVEPKHWDVLKQPPRPPGAGVLSARLIRRMLILAPLMAAGTLGLFAYELYAGSAKHAQTVAFTTLAAFQWFHALNARTNYVSILSVGLLGNAWLWMGIGVAIVLQLLVVYMPMGHLLFGTEPLTALDWLLILVVSSSILIVDEILKRLKVHGTLAA